MNAYGTLLKKLIRFTNIKLTNLAEIVGYDTSYISKWCNKGKLPAAKAAPNVNKCLADVFAREIIIQELQSSSLCNVYESEDIFRFYEKYGIMIDRMLSIEE